MRCSGWLALCVCLLGMADARAGFLKKAKIDRVNAHLAGKVLDFTENSGVDKRIWSEALHERRDLYVYVPPGYDCSVPYPVMLWLNGFMQDEVSFLEGVVQLLDGAIACGKLPPMIIAAPDGSIKGRPSLFSAGSFYINSQAGNFEDFIVEDVWCFLLSHFAIRPERGAHVIAGASMGGFGAYNLGIKHPELFGVILGVFPPVNLRWVNCHGRYMGNFDPCCWGWRSDRIPGREVVGRFYLGLVRVHASRLLTPLFGRGPEVLPSLSRENPIEMLTRYCVQPGEYEMYIAYAGKDQFNIDAQVESFLYRAHQLGLCIGVGYAPHGRHNRRTAARLFPDAADWLAPRVAPYSPIPFAGACIPRAHDLEPSLLPIQPE